MNINLSYFISVDVTLQIKLMFTDVRYYEESAALLVGFIFYREFECSPVRFKVRNMLSKRYLFMM